MKSSRSTRSRICQLVLVAMASYGVVACIDDSQDSISAGSAAQELSLHPDDQSPPDQGDQPPPTARDDAPSFTELTAEQRVEATREVWEIPGHEGAKPPQEVLDARKGDRSDFTVNPDAVNALETLDEQWSEKRHELITQQGLSEGEADRRFGRFQAEFIRQHVGQ